MKVRPLKDFVLIEPIEVGELTNGIYLPDSAKENPVKGTVLDMGDVISDSFKDGDVVYFRNWSGNEIKPDGRKLLIVKVEDLLGVERE